MIIDIIAAAMMSFVIGWFVCGFVAHARAVKSEREHMARFADEYAHKFKQAQKKRRWNDVV